ncbi:MAG: nucleotidyltransferase family protein [Methanothrix sp.]|nr:nucleotidyltransferase family protein [Methanothrix sp.]MDD4446225.1 nucleotidyltransferase family protein [Methanothrix sp.]
MDQLNMSSEDKLLLYCARVNVSDDVAPKIKEILSADIDWDEVIDRSLIQGISPMLYWNLSKINGGKSVPAEILANLRNMYYGNLTRNVLLYNELSNILKAFKELGIDVVVLKGAFLAEAIYKNVGLRLMRDIDLLIKEEDIQRAKMELANLMYYSPIFPSKLHEDWYTKWSEELQFISKNKNVLVDIHWDIQPVIGYPKIDINHLWENVKPTNIAGIDTLMLSPEYILLHLCLHLDKHLFSPSGPPAKPLRNFCDIAEVIRHYKESINWGYLLRISKNYGIEKQIYKGLFVASQCFEAFVPTEILCELKSEEFSFDFENILKTKYTNSPMKKTPSEIGYFRRLSRLNGIRNKVLILFSDVFPCKEYMMQNYSINNEIQVYAYYLVRFVAAIRFGLIILWQLPFYIFGHSD